MSDGSHTLGELAERFGLELRGDASRRIAGVATLAAASGDRLSFLANPAYRSHELRSVVLTGSVSAFELIPMDDCTM